MKVNVSEIKDKMASVLKAKGYSENDIPFMIEMYLGGELRGHTSHGLASFSSFASEDNSNLEEPEIILETASLFMIDAKSNPGTIVGRQAADEAIKRAKKDVVGTALVRNLASWLRPGGIAQYIADRGYVAVVMNDGGGTSIAPPGGFDPTLGTNPIAYGIPTAGDVLAVDIATSKRAWGQVRLANKFGTDLPDDTFYNSKGEVTLDPKDVHSVKPFGEHKGFSLALLVEVMCGSMVGMGMLAKSTSGSSFGGKLPDRGVFILVIDPSQTYDLDKFRQENSDLIDEIKSSNSLSGQEIRIPGDKARELQRAQLEADEIEVAEEVWQEIQGL